MPTRDQLTQERVNALIDVLEAEGVIEPEVADVLRENRNLGDCRGCDRLQSYLKDNGGDGS